MPRKTNEELYDEAERALISDAIAETEQEIHDSAFDNAPDDNDADTSLEEMDSDDVIDDDLEDSESEDVDDDEDAEDDEPEQDDEEPDSREADNEADRVPSRGVPSRRLREEADARRAAEAEARELRARIDALERSQRQPQQPPPQQQPQQGPDMFADPEGWAAAERGRIMQEINNQRFNTSLAEAAEQHGERFQEAFRAVSSLANTPENVSTVQRIYHAPNPGRELMRWHDQQNLIKDIGQDPIAFRQRMREELMADADFRKEVIASLRGEATSQQRTRTQLPPSLNGASGGSGHRGRDNSGRGTAHTTRSLEREIFDSAWDD